MMPGKIEETATETATSVQLVRCVGNFQGYSCKTLLEVPLHSGATCPRCGRHYPNYSEYVSGMASNV